MIRMIRYSRLDIGRPLMWLLVLCGLLAHLPRTSGSIPSITELQANWIDITSPVSSRAQLGPEQRDLPVINNFWGAAGIAPEGVRPVDMFAINSLELPPFAGCGASNAAPYGCGRMYINNQQVSADAVRWAAHEAGRRSGVLSSGVMVESATRMPFEQNGVMWVINVSNPSASDLTVDIGLELTAMVSQYPTVGTWVYSVPNDPSKFKYSNATSSTGQAGVVGCDGSVDQSACAQYQFVGLQPSTIMLPAPSTIPTDKCSLSGNWTQETSGQVFGPLIELGDGSFSWVGNPNYKQDGWNKMNGTLINNKITLHYYRDYPGIPNPGVVTIHGYFIADCAHVHLDDSGWHKQGYSSLSATAPNATFKALLVPAGRTVSLQIGLAVGNNTTAASQAVSRFAGSMPGFEASWADAHDKWQQRWEQVFQPQNGFFSGHLPSLDLGSGRLGLDVMRVYYMSVLTVISQLRTNLEIIYPRAWPNGNGNLGWPNRGIGAARSWWWDEALTSIMLSLLEPDGRAPTLQAWLAHDDHPNTKFGHGMGNGYAMDCQPKGSTSCQGQDVQRVAGPEYGFYCYNPWAYYMAISNHLRINNDTTFLEAQAANSSLSVQEALASIVSDWSEYVIPGTHLVDYGPAMDGFSPTYKHVMPGCSQGNNAWMLRDFATLKDAQHNSSAASALRMQAAAIANDTLGKMYRAKDGRGFFNVIYPPTQASPNMLQVLEMRHVVDMFSVTFGLCGLTKECDLSDTVRQELARWFREELVTATWIRATSPECNCSHTWSIPVKSSRQDEGSEEGSTADFPAYTTCAASRPDHGSNGAYPSWPAFGLEALCYLDGNCSSAFQILASVVNNTYEGPFGQAHETPQLSSPPYTPLNSEVSFKPIAGVTRYVAIEGGSFFDAIVRGFFGYHPPIQWQEAASVRAQDGLEAALHNKDVVRGFEGELTNLRTPYGLATISSGPSGLKISLQHS